MTAMTTAERRGYQMICGDDGAMMVMACDQRGGMRTVLAATPEEQAKIGTDVLGDTKIDIGAYLARHAGCDSGRSDLRRACDDRRWPSAPLDRRC